MYCVAESITTALRRRIPPSLSNQQDITTLTQWITEGKIAPSRILEPNTIQSSASVAAAAGHIEHHSELDRGDSNRVIEIDELPGDPESAMDTRESAITEHPSGRVNYKKKIQKGGNRIIEAIEILKTEMVVRQERDKAYEGEITSLQDDHGLLDEQNRFMKGQLKKLLSEYSCLAKNTKTMRSEMKRLDIKIESLKQEIKNHEKKETELMGLSPPVNSSSPGSWIRQILRRKNWRTESRS